MRIDHNEFPTHNEPSVRKLGVNEPKLDQPGAPPRAGAAGGENRRMDVIHERIHSRKIQIGREQTLREGLDRIADWLGNARGGEGASFVDELVQKARFRGEKVLAPVHDRLVSIVNQNDRQALQSLIEESDSRLARSLGELDRDIVASQNLAAADQRTEKRKLDELMTSVIQGMSRERTGSGPIDKERAVDLLG